MDYFKDDEYWRRHVHRSLEEDMWIEDFREAFPCGGKALDLGCGVGQYSRRLMEWGCTVTSADISEIALGEVGKFNPDTVRLDMREPLPFEDGQFDLVFANLSIHYFSDEETKKLVSEIRRILRPGGVFAGTVNGMQGAKIMGEIADEVEPHYWINRSEGRCIRLFDRADLERYMACFEACTIEEREIIRFGNVKNYLIFLCRK